MNSNEVKVGQVGSVHELAKYVADYESGIIASRGAINDRSFDKKRIVASKAAIASGSEHEVAECLNWWYDAISTGSLQPGKVQAAFDARFIVKEMDAGNDQWSIYDKQANKYWSHDGWQQPDSGLASVLDHSEALEMVSELNIQDQGNVANSDGLLLELGKTYIDPQLENASVELLSTEAFGGFVKAKLLDIDQPYNARAEFLQLAPVVRQEKAVDDSLSPGM